MSETIAPKSAPSLKRFKTVVKRSETIETISAFFVVSQAFQDGKRMSVSVKRREL
jgi:hypothetical protein